jgi:putative (di)nucleoside polyphosphate hydrolase
MVFGRSGHVSLPYRPNVGILLLSVYNLLWVGERIDLPGAWQMPQGGMEPGETIEEAFFREAGEELGLGRDFLQILDVSEKPLRYEFPLHVMRRQPNNQYRGQEQHWVVARFLGRDSDINIHTAEPEFSNWRWVTASQLMDLVVPFKRGTYSKVLKEFRHLVLPG